jgi:hypothetical protein
MKQMNPMNPFRGLAGLEKNFLFGGWPLAFLGSSGYIKWIFIHFQLITMNKFINISSLDVSNVYG